jgi:hypothetical protein
VCVFGGGEEEEGGEGQDGTPACIIACLSPAACMSVWLSLQSCTSSYSYIVGRGCKGSIFGAGVLRVLNLCVCSSS